MGSGVSFSSSPKPHRVRDARGQGPGHVGWTTLGRRSQLCRTIHDISHGGDVRNNGRRQNLGNHPSTVSTSPGNLLPSDCREQVACFLFSLCVPTGLASAPIKSASIGFHRGLEHEEIVSCPVMSKAAINQVKPVPDLTGLGLPLGKPQTSAWQKSELSSPLFDFQIKQSFCVSLLASNCSVPASLSTEN